IKQERRHRPRAEHGANRREELRVAAAEAAQPEQERSNGKPQNQADDERRPSVRSRAEGRHTDGPGEQKEWNRVGNLPLPDVEGSGNGEADERDDQHPLGNAAGPAKARPTYWARGQATITTRRCRPCWRAAACRWPA